MSRRRHTRALLPLGLVLAVSAAACGGGPDTSGVIDREVFITTYVDLRAEALSSEGGEITDESRASVLSRNGVTEADLTAFAELHGPDVELMRDVWNEVEIRLEERRPPREGVAEPPG